MTLKSDWIAYQARWLAVAKIEQQEWRIASVDKKWKQLNSIVSLAMRMGIFKPDPSELEVYQRWAKLKTRADKPSH